MMNEKQFDITDCIPYMEEDIIESTLKPPPYQKYREHFHPKNIKNKIKWNRIRSNPNLKRGRIK